MEIIYLGAVGRGPRLPPVCTNVLIQREFHKYYLLQIPPPSRSYLVLYITGFWVGKSLGDTLDLKEKDHLGAVGRGPRLPPVCTKVQGQEAFLQILSPANFFPPPRTEGSTY